MNNSSSNNNNNNNNDNNNNTKENVKKFDKVSCEKLTQDLTEFRQAISENTLVRGQAHGHTSHRNCTHRVQTLHRMTGKGANVHDPSAIKTPDRLAKTT
jgi:tRNA U55 pseudouridine synthase TruB